MYSSKQSIISVHQLKFKADHILNVRVQRRNVTLEPQIKPNVRKKYPPQNTIIWNIIEKAS